MVDSHSHSSRNTEIITDYFNINSIYTTNSEYGYSFFLIYVDTHTYMGMAILYPLSSFNYFFLDTFFFDFDCLLIYPPFCYQSPHSKENLGDDAFLLSILLRSCKEPPQTWKSTHSLICKAYQYLATLFSWILLIPYFKTHLGCHFARMLPDSLPGLTSQLP